jgi:Glycosyltransferase family 87
MKLAKLFQNKLFVAALLTLITIGITAQSFLKKQKTFDSSGLVYTHFNNYVIFKQSYFHLVENKDLYILYPAEHWDLFKYSPSFSVLMAPMALLPDALGLFFWNALNVLVLFFALWSLPNQSNKTRLFMLGFILIELITSTQNAQSNGLIAGLFILAYTSLEKKQVSLAALFILLTVFIKLFGIVAFALFLFYPNKLKSAAYVMLWGLLLLLLPLIFVSPNQLVFLYKSWGAMLQEDHGISTGLSVAGWLSTWFGLEAKTLVVVVGAFLFCLPFINYKYFKETHFKLFYLCSILIWVIIFNHRAESATFVIAVSGVAIWYFLQNKSTLNTVLIVATFILTVLSPTDLFPKTIRVNYVVPYVLKAIPCILIWFKITYDLLFYKPDKYKSIDASI